MERKLNIKVLLPEDVIEKYDIDEDTGVLSYRQKGGRSRMTYVYLICFLLSVIAVICLLGLTPEGITTDLMKFVSPKQTLRDKVLAQKGRKKSRKLTVELNRIRDALITTGKGGQFTIACASSLLLMLIGCIVAIAIGNAFLIPVLAIAFALIPFAYAKRTISYNANGGSNVPASQTKVHGVTLTLSSTIPYRFNYEFLGWSTSSSATTATYTAGGSYTGNVSVTLYAVWKYKPTTYTVSYDANGGTGAPGRQTKTYGVTLTLTTIQPTRRNYLFLGWSKDRNATSASYSAGGSYTDNADVTLYAVWRYDPETYTIRYDANGGTGAPASQTKTYGVPLTLSAVKPTRAGYEFLGWSTDPTTMLTNYAPGERYTDEASITLYAVWRYVPKTYTVSYDANGGGNTPASQIKTEDVTLTLTSTIPTRYGYTFRGWAISPTATTADYQAGGSYTANESVTLYAVWEINTYITGQ